MTSATIAANSELEMDKGVVTQCPISFEFGHHAVCTVGKTRDLPDLNINTSQ